MTLAHTDQNDPKGLIRESYRIDGITSAECRSIFLDWALSMPINSDHADAINRLLERYSNDNPDHPMTEVLRDGLLKPKRIGRRGGRAGRMS